MPKSKINKVRTVLQKELLECTLQKGGQSKLGMCSYPKFSIKALHFRKCREYHLSRTGRAVSLDPCQETDSSAPPIPPTSPVLSSREVTHANTVSLMGKVGTDSAESSALTHLM